MEKPSEYLRIGKSELHAPSFRYWTKQKFVETYMKHDVTWDIDNAWQMVQEKIKEVDRYARKKEEEKAKLSQQPKTESFQEKLTYELMKKDDKPAVDASPDKGRKKRPKA